MLLPPGGDFRSQEKHQRRHHHNNHNHHQHHHHRFTVRAAAFANEATVRSRPGLAASLSSAGVSLVTVPSTRNAADAMVVSRAAEALSASRNGSGESALSALVFCSADNYFSGFLRYASYKGVRTFVAGDFDNNRARGGKAVVGRRRRKSGERSRSRSSSRSDNDDDAVDASAVEEEQEELAPWRRKELPAAADGAALWSDVLIEARELLLLSH